MKNEFVIYGKNVSPEVLSALLEYFVDYLQSLISDIKGVLEDGSSEIISVPIRLASLEKTCKSLIAGQIFDVEMDEYRTALALSCRYRLLYLRERRGRLLAQVTNIELLAGIEDNINLLGEILHTPAVRTVTDAIPLAGDYVNLGLVYEIENRKEREMAPTARKYDEKFSILLAPSMFRTDFNFCQRQALIRRRDFAVAYIDIDDFKQKFNTPFSETQVDSKFLPSFMRRLEAYCFSRANVYREGGDEYLVLLHNTSQHEVTSFLKQLQEYLKGMEVLLAPDPPTVTVSIGYHLVTRNMPVTEAEARILANSAKAWAKENGKSSGKGRIEPSSADNIQRVLRGEDPVLPKKEP